MPSALAGSPWTLYLNFYNEGSGTLTDPTSVQLDITYGTELGFAPEVAGPFTYQGASSPAAGQVWRIGVGQYAYIWPVPLGAAQGVYVANWSCVFDGDTFLGVENFPVTGGATPAVPSGDTGFWTGGIIYSAAGIDIEFGSTDSNGITWLWQKIQGWDGPDVQGGGVIARSGDHGAWASPQYFAARTMTLTVTASAPTQTLRDVARARLQQAVPVSDLAMLRYDEPVPTYSWVRRSGKITEAYPTLTDVTFTIGLVAPDPRKYAVAQRSLPIGLLPSGGGGSMVEPFTVPFGLASAPPPGGGTAVNAGSFISPPVIVVAGPISSPALTNLTSGQTVSWSSLTLNTGDVFVVDFLNRQGFVNPTMLSTAPGFPSTGGTYWPADPSSSWWQLAPGTTSIQLGGTAAALASATAYWQDAWI
ncbi:phage tail family protein [Kitasatospora kifunensis]|uniref:Minor tail protein n=1 Tax=Kitasatospora kifunensis TaxID=58351 RepID=A0A7W7QYR7_KITKI|nr:phage tail family protein [Kitasatospora kifunensis]MBB4922282.1 hypothetical protein [Kitasatospora kifunensis]